MSSTESTCTSRHLSWFMKSCFPDPTNHRHPSPVISTSAAAGASSTTTTTLSTLPDDILLECLSRVPTTTIPSLPAVCRRWRLLLHHPQFHLLRRRHHPTSRALFAFSLNSNFTLLIASLSLNSSDHNWKFSTSSSDYYNNILHCSHFRLVSVRRHVYLISRAGMLRLDTWTGAVTQKSGMSVSRKKFAAAAVEGRIYVAGGCSSAAVEEYDPDEDSWRVVSHAPRRRYGCVGASSDGLFYVIGGLRIGNEVGEHHHVYASSMDLYDVALHNWLRSRAVPGGGCVVAACSANDGHLYVLSSHAVELSFWKFDARRKSSNVFGEWRRLRRPPLPAQVRLDGAVRFSCVSAGNAVVLIQVAGCVDDLLRRGGLRERGLKEGVVLVYECEGGEWQRSADLPEVMRRAACAAVEW